MQVCKCVCVCMWVSVMWDLRTLNANNESGTTRGEAEMRGGNGKLQSTSERQMKVESALQEKCVHVCICVCVWLRVGVLVQRTLLRLDAAYFEALARLR